MQISYMDLPHAPTSSAAVSSAGDRSAPEPDQAPAGVQSSSAQPQETGRSVGGANDAWSMNGPSSSAPMGTVDVVWPPASSSWERVRKLPGSCRDVKNLGFKI